MVVAHRTCKVVKRMVARPRALTRLDRIGLHPRLSRGICCHSTNGKETRPDFGPRRFPIHRCPVRPFILLKGATSWKDLHQCAGGLPALTYIECYMSSPSSLNSLMAALVTPAASSVDSGAIAARWPPGCSNRALNWSSWKVRAFTGRCDTKSLVEVVPA